MIVWSSSHAIKLWKWESLQTKTLKSYRIEQIAFKASEATNFKIVKIRHRDGLVNILVIKFTKFAATFIFNWRVSTKVLQEKTGKGSCWRSGTSQSESSRIKCGLEVLNKSGSYVGDLKLILTLLFKFIIIWKLL